MPDKKEMTNNEAIRNAVNSLSKVIIVYLVLFDFIYFWL